MRPIEPKPIPMYSKGLTGDLKRLKQPTDSFLIENKGLKKAVLYSTASRLGFKVITRPEPDGLRVWRNFEEVAPDVSKPAIDAPDEEPMSVEDIKQAKLAKARLALAGVIEPEIPLPPVNEWAGYSDIQQKYDDATGEYVTFRQHIKSGKVIEISRASFE